LKKRFLREVRRALAGELGALAPELRLGHDDLLVKASDEAPEILAPLVSEWRELEEVGPSWWVAVMFIVGLLTVYLGLAVRDLGEGSSASSLSLALLSIGLPLLVAGLVEMVEVFGGAVERARTVAARRRLGERLEDIVKGWLTQQINEAREFSFATTLSFRGSARLAEIDDSNHEISTTAKNRLEGMLKRMPGGAIAIAGPRGVGKSTLMRSVCRMRRNAEGRRIHSVVVHAPVEYEPRDFILHLFAEICSQLVGPRRVARLRGWNRPFGRRSGIVRTLRDRPVLMLGPLLMAAGILLPRWPEMSSSISMTRSEAGLALFVFGTVLASITVAGERFRLIELAQERLVSRSSPEDKEHVQTALIRLHQIWFQQTFSSGWAGGFKAPLLSLEGKMSSETELAERQMSYPDVVGLLRDFLELISSEESEVRIGIDELDKMEADAAQRFLNNIKVIFRVPNCFFFVAVSEEAMSSFERRVSFRDVFDSSFDEVLRVSHLELTRSIELIHRRVVALPLPFIYLLHGISGGLPRDLIRATRELFEMEEGTTLEDAAAYLIDRSLKERIHATKIAARHLESEDGKALLWAWLKKAEFSLSTDELLALCKSFDRDFLDPLLRAVDEADLLLERRKLRRLGTEIAAAAYLGATMSQFCEKLESKSFAERLLIEAMEAKGQSRIDILATAFQAFGGDIESAWETIASFRRELGLSILEFPRGGENEDPEPLAA
jgi:energy-coupling factor transporter ATP-binding protein EcfA2